MHCSVASDWFSYLLVAVSSTVVSLAEVEVTVWWVLVRNSKLPPPVMVVSLVSWIYVGSPGRGRTYVSAAGGDANLRAMAQGFKGMGFNVSGLMVMGRMGLMVCLPRPSRPSRRLRASLADGCSRGEPNSG